MEIDIFEIEEIAVVLFLIATIVGIVARRLRMPYTVGLVIVGAALAIFFQEFSLEVSPELILGIFVPPLIFEAAFHLPFQDLRRNLFPIITLAILGVLITTFMVGEIVHIGAGIERSYAIIFGAIVAATDPVAVIALFRSLGVPKRLQVLLEGESLLNDGTAIVIFSIAVTAATSDTPFSITQGMGEFLKVAGAGLIIGAMLGWVASQAISRIDDHLIETAITFVLAYGAYVAAEAVHVSGVLAVVAAGLVNGNVGPRGMSPTTRIVVFNFWEFMSFIANSFVFLLIGLVINTTLITENWQAILWGIGATLIARLIVVYGLFPRSKSIPFRWKHVLYWGGLRGAISLALVLGLSSTFKNAPAVSGQMQAMVFGLVIFTLLIQGTSMNPLIKHLKIVPDRHDRMEYDLRRAQAVSARAGFEYLKRIYREGLVSTHVWEQISGTLEPYIKSLTQSMQDVLKKHPEVEAEELDSAWREFLRRQRIMLTELLADRSIGEDIFSELTARIDKLLESQEIRWDDIQDVRSALDTAIDTKPPES